MKKALVLSVLAAFALSGCASTLPIQSGGVIEKNSGKRVTATASSFNFFNLTPMGIAVSEQATASLQQQCAGGNVTGVTALAKQTWLFVGIRETIEVAGYCAE